MAAVIIGMIASILLTAGGYAYQEGTQAWGNDIRRKAEQIAKQIYTKLSANSQTREKLMEAYQQKDSSLLSSLINQAGYSNQKVALTKAITNARKEYNTKKKELDRENTELTNQYNKVNNAANYSGSTLSANRWAEDTVNEVDNLVNGGYHEEEKIQQKA
jgi:3-dehydroquinate dehydratase